MVETILTIVLFWAVFFSITAITHYIYIQRGIDIPDWSYFDMYPWLCFKCMTTWTLIAAYVTLGIIIKDALFTGLGVLLSALYGYGLYKLEKERTE